MDTSSLITFLIIIILALIGTLWHVFSTCSKARSTSCPFTPLTHNEKQSLTHAHTHAHAHAHSNIATDIDNVDTRDRRVLHDPLYPPLDRVSRAAIPDIRPLSSRGDSTDTFRLMAYLVNTQNKNDVWKLYGRQKHARGSEGEFYITSADRTIDIKIPLDRSSGLHDIYALPSEITIKSPLFDGNATYQIAELSKTDFSSSLYL